jgi:hypothetical protein
MQECVLVNYCSCKQLRQLLVISKKDKLFSIFHSFPLIHFPEIIFPFFIIFHSFPRKYHVFIGGLLKVRAGVWRVAGGGGVLRTSY